MLIDNVINLHLFEKTSKPIYEVRALSNQIKRPFFNKEHRKDMDKVQDGVLLLSVRDEELNMEYVQGDIFYDEIKKVFYLVEFNIVQNGLVSIYFISIDNDFIKEANTTVDFHADYLTYKSNENEHSIQDIDLRDAVFITNMFYQENFNKTMARHFYQSSYQFFFYKLLKVSEDFLTISIHYKSIDGFSVSDLQKLKYKFINDAIESFIFKLSIFLSTKKGIVQHYFYNGTIAKRNEKMFESDKLLLFVLDKDYIVKIKSLKQEIHNDTKANDYIKMENNMTEFYYALNETEQDEDAYTTQYLNFI